MPRFISLCAGAVLLAVLGSPVLAASDSHTADAERFLKLTNADRLAVPVYAQVQQLFAQRFAEAKAPESKQATLERYQAQANAALDKAVGWDKLRPELVVLYTSQFSEKELEGLIEFYESSLGKKMLERLPELNARSAQLAQARLEAAAPEVNRLLGEMSAELAPKQP
ncbi:DUF2059 domain-containing protein [Stutzerimonas azotifigens]|uniref:DUF2059 domain-containing protein n=1 Tax=Stutzerimonas azotifigens TaxID=291995 RepID=UPI0003FF1866|nr:DUF2059 domain-containing protein [Stutzerimonas azotifigens]